MSAKLHDSETTLYIEREDGTLLCSKSVLPHFDIAAKADDGMPGKIVMVVSDESVDADGDIVHQRSSSKGPGWDLTRFKRSPVLTWQHDLRVPNISGPATKAVVRKHPDLGWALHLDPAQFDVGDVFAQEIEGKIRRGVLKESSVGFIILNREPRTDDVGQRVGLHIYGSDLIEVAIANRGSNGNTDVLAKRMLGYKDIVSGVQTAGSTELIDLKAEVEHLAQVVELLTNQVKALTDDEETKAREVLDAQQRDRQLAAKELLASLRKAGLATPSN